MFTDPQQRRANWICLTITFFNILTGITIMVFFINETFSSFKEIESDLNSINDNFKIAFISLFAVLGAYISRYVSTLFKPERILKWGHLLMGVLMVLIAQLIRIEFVTLSFLLICVTLAFYEVLNSVL